MMFLDIDLIRSLSLVLLLKSKFIFSYRRCYSEIFALSSKKANLLTRSRKQIYYLTHFFTVVLLWNIPKQI